MSYHRSLVGSRFGQKGGYWLFSSTAAIQPLGRGSAAATAKAATNASSKSVVGQRAVYQEQMTELRKKWGEELEQKQQREEQRRTLEKQRLVLEKAIRLREKRKASLARQEQAKKKREEALSRYRDKLARNHVVHAQRQARQHESYRNLVSAIEAESSTWITLENMNSKIVEDLFSAPATTGLVTRESKHWRHHVLTMQLKRMLSPEYISESSASGSSLADRLQQRGQAKSVKRLMIEDFIEPMISSGKERANYQEIIDKFAAKMEDHYVIDEELDTYFDYIMNNSGMGDEDEDDDDNDGSSSSRADGGSSASESESEAAELAKIRALQDAEEAVPPVVSIDELAIEEDALEPLVVEEESSSKPKKKVNKKPVI